MTRVGDAFNALKALPVSSAILDAAGTIVSVNDTWRDFGRRNGLCLPNAGVGSSYLQYCTGGDSGLMTELKALLAGKLDLLTLVYPCHSPGKERWFSLIGVPLSLGKPAGVALVHANLTSMLTLQNRASSTEAERNLKQPTTDAHAMSGAIERSVSKTLSSQLDTMAGHRQVGTRKMALHREYHPILVPARLSKRQLDVLRLLGEGKTNKEIGETLFRSPNTIKLHVSAILKQLKLKSRTQAALLASTLYAEGSPDLPEGDLQSWKKTKIGATQPRPRA